MYSGEGGRDGKGGGNDRATALSDTFHSRTDEIWRKERKCVGFMRVLQCMRWGRVAFTDAFTDAAEHILYRKVFDVYRDAVMSNEVTVP